MLVCKDLKNMEEKKKARAFARSLSYWVCDSLYLSFLICKWRITFFSPLKSFLKIKEVELLNILTLGPGTE